MPDEINGLDGLKARHRIFQFTNRTQSQQFIMLADGDRMSVQPGAVGKCLSALLSQLPELSKFEYKVPTTQELIDAGVIGSAEEAKAVPAAAVERNESDVKQKGGQPLKTNRDSE